MVFVVVASVDLPPRLGIATWNFRLVTEKGEEVIEREETGVS